MAHTVRDRAKLIARVRRIKGQCEAIERALEAGYHRSKTHINAPRTCGEFTFEDVVAESR